MPNYVSECTQNAPFWDRKFKNFQGRGTDPFLDPSSIGEGTPLPKSYFLGACGASILTTSALEVAPLIKNPGSSPSVTRERGGSTIALHHSRHLYSACYDHAVLLCCCAWSFGLFCQCRCWLVSPCSRYGHVSFRHQHTWHLSSSWTDNWMCDNS